MSDRTTSVPTPQVEVPTPQTPAQATEQPVAASEVVAQGPSPAQPSAAEQTAEQARQAAELAAEQEAKAREEAASTLKAVVRAYRQGEKAYRAGLLEAGRLADQYLRQRLALGDKRKAAVQTLEGQLSQYASDTVDVNRLVGCYQAYRLLAEGLLPGAEQDTKEAKAARANVDQVPYGHYRDAWRQLVQRARPDTAEEEWVLLPGLEEQARALYAKAVADHLSLAAVQEQVRGLQRQYADAQAAKARQEAQQAEEQARAKLAEVRAAAEAAEKAEAQARAKAQEAERAKAEEKARLTAEAEQAKAELLARQQALAASHAERAQAEAARARAEQVAQEAAKAAERALAKATKAAEAATARATAKVTKAGTPSTSPAEKATVSGNLLATAKTGTAKDVAGMCLELITGSDTPDDVLEHLLRQLKDSGQVSGKAKRALDAALLVLTRTDKPAAPAGGPSSLAVEAAAILAQRDAARAEAKPEQANGQPTAA